MGVFEETKGEFNVFIYRQQEMNCHSGYGLSIYKISKSASTVTFFPTKLHLLSKVSPPNSTTTYSKASNHMSLWWPYIFKQPKKLT